MSNDLLFTRRIFMKRGAGLLSAAATLPVFLDRSARVFAAEPTYGIGSPDRILVVLQLAGGNDGLNTVVPVRDDDYYRARPRLAIPAKSTLRLTAEAGLHPALAGLKGLYDQGQMSVIQAVGYPNPNRSHFRSTDIWATAEPEKLGVTGWLGRYFDNTCVGSDPGDAKHRQEMTPAQRAEAFDPRYAIGLTEDPPTSLRGEQFVPLAFENVNRLEYRRFHGDPTAQEAFEQLNSVDRPTDAHDAHDMIDDPDHRPHRPMPRSRAGMGRMETGVTVPKGTHGSLEQDNQATDFIQRSALNTRVYADQIQTASRRVQNLASYPGNRLAQDLKLVAQLIAADMPTRVYYVSMGGFDTHANQAGRHERLLTEFSTAVSAFMDDLAKLNQLDRVTLMTFSEFGRRVNENASSGTDHGEAAPMFLFGNQLRAGVMGRTPDLNPNKLHRGDLPYSVDFRSVYATVLRDWMKADDEAILGDRFKRFRLLKG